VRAVGARRCSCAAALGEGAAGAADEGRAFVNGKRAAAEAAVAVGDAVEIWSARETDAEDARVRVIARWGEILAAYKPAALPTTPDRRGDASLVVEVGKIIRRAMPHAASRLDVGVSGVVLCALGAQGLAHIEAMRSEGRLMRTYVALAAGLIEGEGTWSAPIGRERGSSGRLKPSLGGRDAETAATRFRAVSWARPCSAQRGGRSTLLVAEPVTGRMHQIRVHAAAAGAPLIGDREHGGPRSIVAVGGRVHSVDRIGLHAIAVELPGPRGEVLRATAEVPADLRLLWKTLDGPDEAWNDIQEPRLAGGIG